MTKLITAIILTFLIVSFAIQNASTTQEAKANCERVTEITAKPVFDRTLYTYHTDVSLMWDSFETIEVGDCITDIKHFF